MANIAEITREWTSHESVVAAFIASAIPEFNDCQDVLQDVAVSVIESAARYDSTRPFVAWAMAIARRRIIDFQRRNSGNRVLFDSEVVEFVEKAFTELQEIASPTSEALEQCLKVLPKKSTRLLEMRYHRQLKSQEIALQVGALGPAIDKALHRIRLVLRDCIENRLAATGRAI